MLHLIKKIIRQIYYSSVYLLFGLFFGIKKVFAQKPTLENAVGFTENAANKAGVAEASVETVVSNALKTGISIVGLLFFVLMFYGGFIWMTARGNEDQIRKGRNAVIAATIGLSIVIGAYAITALLGNVV